MATVLFVIIVIVSVLQYKYLSTDVLRLDVHMCRML